MYRLCIAAAHDIGLVTYRQEFSHCGTHLTETRQKGRKAIKAHRDTKLMGGLIEKEQLCGAS